MNNPYLAIHLNQYFNVFFLFSFNSNYYHKNLLYIFNHLSLHQFHLVFHHQYFINFDILSLILAQFQLWISCLLIISELFLELHQAFIVPFLISILQILSYFIPIFSIFLFFFIFLLLNLFLGRLLNYMKIQHYLFPLIYFLSKS